MIVKNEYFNLFLENDKVVIHAVKAGYPLKSFDLISREHPRLKIDSFLTLRKALIEIESDHIIGTWAPLVEVTVSTNRMSVEIIANTTIEQLHSNKQQVIDAANERLDQLGIVYGRQNLSEASWAPGVPIIGAQGTAPINGADAIATYIERPERKPVIREDGSADHYEMNFVFPVEEDDWLGEKTIPEKGISGSDVYGNEIKALNGTDIILRYDKKSVFEQVEDDKVVIRAIHGGALEFVDDLVTIGKHLSIHGDVGVETGSITFDGSVTVHGTIQADYSVVATGDIAIEGKEGVTNAKMIQSSEGDIYIKGGIFGGGKTIIEARGSIYIKHGNDCKLYGKEIHTGLYLFGSEVVAEDVYVDKHKGRIIGGSVEALYTITCAIVGNNHERKTKLIVKGVNKQETYKDVQGMAKELKKHQEVVERLEAHTAKFSSMVDKLSLSQKEAYDKSLQAIEVTKTQIQKLDLDIQTDLAHIKNAKPAYIEVVKEAFPGTVIQVGKITSSLQQKTNGVFKVDNGVLNV